MDDREPVHGVVVIQQVHDAPGAEVRKGHPADGPLRCRLLERCREPAALGGHERRSLSRQLRRRRRVPFTERAHEQAFRHLALQREAEFSLCRRPKLEDEVFRATLGVRVGPCGAHERQVAIIEDSDPAIAADVATDPGAIEQRREAGDVSRAEQLGDGPADLRLRGRSHKLAECRVGVLQNVCRTARHREGGGDTIDVPPQCLRGCDRVVSHYFVPRRGRSGPRDSSSPRTRASQSGRA